MNREKAESADEEAKAQLLVVDDNRDNREVLQRRLTRRGYQVDAAVSGAEALDAIAARPYDAVLLDIEMPGISGLEVLEQIRERFSKTQLPVVMATARSGSADMVEAFRLGANDYVTKPLDFPVVLARLETHLAMRREAEASKAPPLILAPSEDLPPGTVLEGRYRVEGQLGGGGFAVVYAGRQISSDMPVAIKLLRSHRLLAADAASELARFELETRVIARVSHPAIVRLVDSGTLAVRSSGAEVPPEGETAMATTRLSFGPGDVPPPSQRKISRNEQRVPYLVMERLRGETLADLLAREAPLEARQAIDLMLPILDGMHVVHDQGIVHRDAKPSNIILSRGASGQVEPKILDFGIAKLTHDERPQLTKSAAVVGTPMYVSPEQATARPLDGRSDQYTVATVLFECLNGKPPCQAQSSVEVLQQIADGDIVSMALLDLEADDGLVSVLGRALARDPEDRYPDMRSFGDALLPFASPAAAAHFQHLRADPPSGITPMK